MQQQASTIDQSLSNQNPLMQMTESKQNRSSLPRDSAEKHISNDPAGGLCSSSQFRDDTVVEKELVCWDPQINAANSIIVLGASNANSLTVRPMDE